MKKKLFLTAAALALFAGAPLVVAAQGTTPPPTPGEQMADDYNKNGANDDRKKTKDDAINTVLNLDEAMLDSRLNQENGLSDFIFGVKTSDFFGVNFTAIDRIMKGLDSLGKKIGGRLIQVREFLRDVTDPYGRPVPLTVYEYPDGKGGAGSDKHKSILVDAGKLLNRLQRFLDIIYGIEGQPPGLLARFKALPVGATLTSQGIKQLLVEEMKRLTELNSFLDQLKAKSGDTPSLLDSFGNIEDSKAVYNLISEVEYYKYMKLWLITKVFSPFTKQNKEKTTVSRQNFMEMYNITEALSDLGLIIQRANPFSPYSTDVITHLGNYGTLFLRSGFAQGLKHFHELSQEDAKKVLDDEDEFLDGIKKYLQEDLSEIGKEAEKTASGWTYPKKEEIKKIIDRIDKKIASKHEFAKKLGIKLASVPTGKRYAETSKDRSVLYKLISFNVPLTRAKANALKRNAKEITLKYSRGFVRIFYRPKSGLCASAAQAGDILTCRSTKKQLVKKGYTLNEIPEMPFMRASTGVCMGLDSLKRQQGDIVISCTVTPAADMVD